MLIKSLVAILFVLFKRGESQALHCRGCVISNLYETCMSLLELHCQFYTESGDL